MPSISDVKSLLDDKLAPHKTLTMDDAMPTLLGKTPNPEVGKPVNRLHGDLKVSGHAKYAAEYRFDDELFGVLVCATIGKGKISQIHTDAAKKLSNVVDIVIDFEQFIRHPQQGGKKKSPSQGADTIVYHGQPIALAVAKTFEAATEAAKLVQIEYQNESNDGAFDFAKEKMGAHSMPKVPTQIQGDPEKTLKDAQVSVDKTYTTPSQSNSPIEPHATIAKWDGDSVTLYTANQMLASCKQQVADALDLKPDNVRLVSRFVGGGFGSKLGIAPELIAAAVAAKQLNAPVRVVMSRPQVMEATVRRSNTEQRIGLGADKDGRIHTVIHDTIITNLPDQTFYEPTAESTPFLYQGENRKISYKMVRMNQVLAGSMRAPGEAVGQIALECAMDELAEKLNLDPIELRILNEPKKDPSKDIPYSSRHLVECMKVGAEKFGWSQRQATPCSTRDGDWLVGMGMAVACRVNNLEKSQARASLKLSDQKPLGVEAVIETDMTDIGTGSYTVLAQIAAEMLGLPLDHVVINLGDTNLPPASGSGGSVGAASAGSSVYLACQKLRELIAERANVASDDLNIDNGKVFESDDTEKNNLGMIDQFKQAVKEKAEIVSAEIIDKATKTAKEALNQLSDNANDKKDSDKNDADKNSSPQDKPIDLSSSKNLSEILTHFDDNKISALGTIKPGKTQKEYRQACYGANFVEVGVHRFTGEIRVRRMTGVFTAGKILNHKTATSQCYGGMVFGIGSALMEEIVHDKRTGRLCNHDLAEYHIPVNADVPQLDVTLLDEADEYANPIHIKGIGETAISGAAAAIANAVYNATGVRVYEFPIKIEHLLDKLPDGL
ncbi:xanthine dehydrogenase family protein molybdopterin-binding subunit [Psychrobacter ciconiae]|uniref:xanthine dehydrogenase family protein molybdopterin-binding subunit n=1 Tax=Psychrobacter ciconiae TaxID=1553449 RepID=UPI001919CEC2|nr:xanthine dehydrogenase family protein molybdopterin-binding subunit [Psychrobacter ciconiae]